MNIFYNAGTYQDEVDEYNWIYTSAANGGSAVSTKNNSSSTCITKLDASSDAAAKTSFDGYIKPLEIRNALRFITTNDPRPFYAHQSNLTEDRDPLPRPRRHQRRLHRRVQREHPLVQADMTTEGETWPRWTRGRPRPRRPGSRTATSTPPASTLPATMVKVPLTVPSTSTAAGTAGYAGELSGWIKGTGSDTLAATLNPVGGGYLVTSAPAAPTNVSAVTAGVGAATVSWTPAGDGGSPVLDWTVTAYTGTAPAETAAS